MIAHQDQFRLIAPRPWSGRARTVPAVFLLACLVPMASLDLAQDRSIVVLLCVCIAAIVAAVYAFMSGLFSRSVPRMASSGRVPSAAIRRIESLPGPRMEKPIADDREALQTIPTGRTLAVGDECRPGPVRDAVRHPRRRHRRRATL
jgi:hypothetical protein